MPSSMPKMYINRYTEGQNRYKEAETAFEEIVIANFSDLIKNIKKWGIKGNGRVVRS